VPDAAITVPARELGAFSQDVLPLRGTSSDVGESSQW
jgi:hypothetical protein